MARAISFTTFADHVNADEALSQDCPTPRRGVAKRSKPCRAPKYVAKIKSLALQQTSNEGLSSPVDPAILDCVRKCLARDDPRNNTSQSDMETATRMASRIMAEHNFNEADVISRAAESGEAALVAGRSIVTVCRAQGSTAKRVVNETWVCRIARAMTSSLTASLPLLALATIRGFSGPFTALPGTQRRLPSPSKWHTT